MKGGVFVLTGVSSKQGIVFMIVNVTDECMSASVLNDKYVYLSLVLNPRLFAFLKNISCLVFFPGGQ